MRKITGETRLLAVIGHPVSHSLSPQIHNRFIEAEGLSYAYMAFDVTPEALGEFLRAAGLLNIAGLNLTMPLKETVLPLLDGTEEDARVTRAVNTVCITDGRLRGYNTDGEGFRISLERDGFDFRGRALVLGTGGAAKSVAWALYQKGMDVSLAARRPERVTSIHQDIRVCDWKTLSTAASDCALLVNATPLGMHGAGGDFGDLSFLNGLKSGAIVYDLIYAPRRTMLLTRAEQVGYRTKNGFSHLLFQAAVSFARFTGVTPRTDVLEEILQDYEAGRAL